jgi:transcriptional regulator with PAS, ATPase and Fis domain
LPGNARQLENIVRQALVRKTTDLPLSISDLPVEILLQLSGAAEESVARKPDMDLLNSQTL